ncbi:MAG: BPSS1780 family membrane protein [Pseudomonadota bacterium]
MNRLPARAGLHWLRDGFALFRRQPGVLTMLLFANLLISILVSSVNMVGPLLAVVLLPSFSMAVLQACSQIQQGQRATLAVLLTGFRKPVLPALCKLGLVYLALSMLLAAGARLAIDPSAIAALSAPIDPAHAPQVNPGDLFAMLAVSLLQIVAIISLCFAAPLAVWQDMAIGKAIFYSFFAVLRSARVFLAMLLAWFGLYLMLAVLTLLVLGERNAGIVALTWLMLMFMLVLQCAIYVGYRQIFEPTEPAA